MVKKVAAIRYSPLAIRHSPFAIREPPASFSDPQCQTATPATTTRNCIAAMPLASGSSFTLAK
jgi:hypothetical protein